ncbi:histidine phosphatase family protein [Streptomyces sp. SPB4]|uniref:SixA phosphatase family protein n=1 Tax=Streptomyces sp. SPB4 TaxID=2940553 RepID=UPI002476AFA0|nr:histidine phosphatase family protein [Streptomyces sp. SPB4]MDH6545690.1 phosphohistidine phosphatase [Streptomyces sp. SPB4]MDH6545707.1 phosphohistidine phosphatase [Streptomyces sp. SPB4]
MSCGPASFDSDSADGCRLLLVRHAKAVPKHVAEDFERSLSDRGRADAPATGRWLAASGFELHLVLCSPARRTRETWELIATVLPDVPPAVYDGRLYNAAPAMLATVLAEQGAGLSQVMVVGHGHETGIHELATSLCGTGPPELLERLREELPTSGVAVVDLPGGWADLASRDGHDGHLKAFWAPAQQEPSPK